MAVLKCKMCGGQLEKNDDGTFTCLSCATTQTLESTPTVFKAAIINEQKSEYSNKDNHYYSSNLNRINNATSSLDDSDDDNSVDKDDPEEKEYMLKNGIYLRACELAAKGDVESLSQAVDMYSKISGFRDSDARRLVCEKSVFEQKREIAEKKAREEKIRAKKKKKKRCIISLICIIIIGLSVGIPLKNKMDHDVDRIKINVTDMSSEYKANAQYYVNGCYYIYFDYEIENNTGTDIDYLEVVTYVEDKNGKSIGQITTSFGGYDSSSMNLERKDSVIKETYLSENQPEKNDFFASLYNTEPDDWTLTYKITSVKFSDGQHYFGD